MEEKKDTNGPGGSQGGRGPANRQEDPPQTRDRVMSTEKDKMMDSSAEGSRDWMVEG